MGDDIKRGDDLFEESLEIIKDMKSESDLFEEALEILRNIKTIFSKKS